MKLVLITLSCALLAGCASLTPAGKSVRVTYNTDLVKNCKFIKQVEGQKITWTELGDVGIVNMRNLTAEAGGDTVYVERTTRAGHAPQNALGSAYNCGAPAPGAK
jgi:hypothetical protein